MHHTDFGSSQETRRRHLRPCPDEPWSDIRGVGNMLRHEYDRIDRTMIWDIVTNDLPSLRRAAVMVLEQMRGDTPETQ